jgi:3'(2'), 5'-bisphosphate nucleotidase
VTSLTTDIERSVEHDFAIEAVVTASRVCRRVRAAFEPSEATAKADSSPVTVADLAAQALISMALTEALPGDGLMGEEDSRPLADAPMLADAVLGRVREERPEATIEDVVTALERCDDPGGPARRWWTLDPVDGTKGFLRNEQYAVALALIEDGEVVLAVMGSPNLPVEGAPGAGDGPVGCLFVAERGRGAWQVALDDAGKDSWQIALDGAGKDLAAHRIVVAEVAAASDARYAESVESAHSSQSDAARIAEALSISASPLRLDSQTKYAVVGRGDASIYLRLPRGDYRENVWDHAAGWLIVTEAGGRVSDVDGVALDFTTGTRMTRNRGVVATVAPIHDVVLKAVGSALS